MAIRTLSCFNNFVHTLHSPDLLSHCKPGSKISSPQQLHTHCNMPTSFTPKRKRRSLTPGEVSKTRWVPDHIPRPSYISFGDKVALASKIEVHDQHGISCMRASGNLAARVLQYAGTLVMPGITTDAIDDAVHQMIIDNGAYPSPLGYNGFPKSVCTSVNECICHGIPDSRTLEDGDIINIDVTVYLNDHHGDTSATFLVGEVDAEAKVLVEVAKECLQKAVAVCGPGAQYSKIGDIINDYADKYGFGVMEFFVGHGIGRTFHSEPVIIHCWNDVPGRMMLNQTFTIEPALTGGSTDFKTWNDGWTVLTKDRSLSAQFEHTVLITHDGVDILTTC